MDKVGYITVHRVKGSNNKGNFVVSSKIQTLPEAENHRKVLSEILPDKDYGHVEFETVTVPVYFDNENLIREKP